MASVERSDEAARSAEAPAARVLVVEDDEDLREVIFSTLIDAGHRVVGASSVDEARESLRTLQPEVVLLDARLDGRGDGQEGPVFAHELTRLVRPTPMIIGMSGAIDGGGFLTALEVAFFLVKPFGSPSLRNVVTEAVRRLRVDRAARSGTRRRARHEVVLVVGAQPMRLMTVLPSALAGARVVVVESEADALRLLGDLKSSLIVLDDRSPHRRLREEADRRGITTHVVPTK